MKPDSSRRRRRFAKTLVFGLFLALATPNTGCFGGGLIRGIGAVLGGVVRGAGALLGGAARLVGGAVRGAGTLLFGYAPEPAAAGSPAVGTPSASWATEALARDGTQSLPPPIGGNGSSDQGGLPASGA